MFITYIAKNLMMKPSYLLSRLSTWTSSKEIRGNNSRTAEEKQWCTISGWKIVFHPLIVGMAGK